MGEEGCCTRKVLLVVVAGHTQGHSSDCIGVVVSAMEEDIHPGCNLQKDTRVEVIASNHNHHHRPDAVGHHSHLGLDNRTLPAM